MKFCINARFYVSLQREIINNLLTKKHNYMAMLVFIVGDSGEGKSTSFRNLNPDETFIVNSDQKALPFKSFKTKYNIEKGNYAQTSSYPEVIAAMKAANKNAAIKTLIVDTFTRIGTDYIMSPNFRQTKGFEKWSHLAGDLYDVINIINDRLREDLIVYLVCHPYTAQDEFGNMSKKIAVQGKQLEKFTLESFSSIVLYTNIKKAPGQPNEFTFSGENNNNSAKVPMELLENNEIPNDLVILNTKIREYFEI
tara:strand:+ start:883 stop:1638 length:756 start_codon:yes stop_codon:yes gene_type:complete